MEQVLQIANSPVLWMFAILVIGVVVVQALMYLRMTLSFSSRYSILTPDETSRIYKTAAINSIGLRWRSSSWPCRWSQWSARP